MTETQRRQPVLLLQTYTVINPLWTMFVVDNTWQNVRVTNMLFFVTHSKTLKLIYFNWTNVSKWNTLLSLREGVGTSCSFVGVVWGWAILCPLWVTQVLPANVPPGLWVWTGTPTVVETFLHLATWGFRAHLGSHHHSVFWLLNWWFVRLWWEWKYLHVINHLTAC